MNESTLIASISTDTREKALKYYNVKQPITPISLGLVKPSFEKVERKDLDLSDDDIIMISIGRLGAESG